MSAMSGPFLCDGCTQVLDTEGESRNEGIAGYSVMFLICRQNLAFSIYCVTFHPHKESGGDSSCGSKVMQ